MVFDFLASPTLSGFHHQPILKRRHEEIKQRIALHYGRHPLLWVLPKPGHEEVGSQENLVKSEISAILFS